MRVLNFGTYERAYPRNAQVAACLRRAGVEVVERHIPVWESQEHKWDVGAASALRLLAAELRLLAPPRVQFDVLRVGYPGHLDMAAAKLAARGRPIVFDPLLSLYDSFVADRGRFAPGSLPARLPLAVRDSGLGRGADRAALGGPGAQPRLALGLEDRQTRLPVRPPRRSVAP